MTKGIISDINNLAERYSAENPYTNIYGIARSLLALSTLLTLMFNKWDLLFPDLYEKSIVTVTVFDKLNIFLFFGYSNIYATIIFCMLILLLVIVGVVPQVTSILQFWISYSFFRYCPIVDGGDQIISILTFTLIPFSILDNRFNHWSKPKEKERPYINISAHVILIFIQIQMSFLYFHSFIGKLKVEEWLDGTDVYYWFTNNVFGFPTWLRHFAEPFLYYNFVVTTLTWGTLLLEFFLFAAIFMTPKWKNRFFIIAIFFHFGILLIHGLVSFFFAMAGGLMLYLLPSGNELRIQGIKILKNGFSRKAAIT